MVGVEKHALMNITFPTSNGTIVVQFAGDADVDVDDFREDFAERVIELSDDEATVVDVKKALLRVWPSRLNAIRGGRLRHSTERDKWKCEHCKQDFWPVEWATHVESCRDKHE